MPQRRILSIDGGGIRGIIPISALIKLEQTTGTLARDTFSFVAGTSTGAIIAAAIAAGIPASRILNMYVARSREIFTRTPFNVLRRILLGSMYSTHKLHQVIGEELGVAATWTLNDSPIDLLITAKRVNDGMPWYFTNDAPANAGRTGSLPLVDCATASAAAPTYFYPWVLPTIGALVDGSVGVAGNPVYQACVEAFYYNDHYIPEETTVISLGTGRIVQDKRPKWFWPWIEWLLGELFRSPGEQQTEIVQRHFPDLTFYRLDLALDQQIELDDVRSIDRLMSIGERFAEQINWEAILDGTDERFRINSHKTLWTQYCQR